MEDGTCASMDRVQPSEISYSSLKSWRPRNKPESLVDFNAWPTSRSRHVNCVGSCRRAPLIHAALSKNHRCVVAVDTPFFQREQTGIVTQNSNALLSSSHYGKWYGIMVLNCTWLFACYIITNNLCSKSKNTKHAIMLQCPWYGI